MRKLLLFLFVAGLSLTTHCSANGPADEGIPVFQGRIRLNKDGRSLSYAFARGDKLLLKVETDKRKEIRAAKLTTLSGRQVWSMGSSESFEVEIPIEEEGVYTLSIDKKGLFNQTINLDLLRKAGAVTDFNPAWQKQNRYHAENISFKVDSVVGYEPAVLSEQDFRVFNKYYYQNISLYDHREQVKGNMALDGSHVKGFAMGINPSLVPKDAKFKCYNYSLSAVLGGQKHWAIAELASQIGGTAASIFLTPAAGFAVHGSMALIGPAPNKAPVMYYMSNRESDIKTISEMKSNSGKVMDGANTVTGAVSSFVGLFSDNAGKAVKNATKINTKNEGDLDYTQKGNVTNLFVTSALPPTEKYFIMTNSYLAHAKNIHLSATALYYVPTFFTVKAQEEMYNLKTMKLDKTETKYTKSTTYVSIND